MNSTTLKTKRMMTERSPLEKISEKQEQDLRRILHGHRKGINDRYRLFRAQWFIWRSALPVAIVSNLRIDTVLCLDGRYPKKAISMPRNLSIWIARDVGDLTFSQIGAVLSRDHTTIVHSTRLIDRALERGDEAVTDLLHQVLELESRWVSRK